MGDRIKNRERITFVETPKHRRSRINPVDLTVLVVVVALVLYVGYRVVEKHFHPVPLETVRYEVLAPEVLPQAAQEIHPGDHLVSGNNVTSAVITSVQVTPAMMGVTRADGTRARVADPYLKDVLVWVQDRVPAGGGAISSAGQTVQAGGSFILKTRLFSNTKATVLTVRPGDS